MKTMQSVRQGGAALFIVLILLLAITIIGVSSMNDTLTQGKMASAMQDSNLALQGVEVALREAEAVLRETTGNSDFDGEGLYAETTAPSHSAASTWSGTNSIEGAMVDGLAEEPRYFIEIMGEVAGDPSGGALVSMDNADVANALNTGTNTTYRIVARSTGASGKSVRTVEAYYGKRE